MKKIIINGTISIPNSNSTPNPNLTLTSILTLTPTNDCFVIICVHFPLLFAIVVLPLPGLCLCILCVFISVFVLMDVFVDIFVFSAFVLFCLLPVFLPFFLNGLVHVPCHFLPFVFISTSHLPWTRNKGPFVECCLVLSCVVFCCLVSPFLVLSCLILSCLVLSCRVVSCRRRVSCRGVSSLLFNPICSSLFFFYRLLTCLVWSVLLLSCFVFVVLPCFVLSQS
jgi:hypothetical protein